MPPAKTVARRTPSGVLAEARQLITGPRRQDYGNAEESFSRIADLWSPVLGYEVTPEQVALCLLQLKVARYVVGQQRDSLVDLVGYAALLAELHGWDV